jgi:hypothetical protein
MKSNLPIIFHAIKEMQKQGIVVNIPNISRKTGLSKLSVRNHVETLQQIGHLDDLQILNIRVDRALRAYALLNEQERRAFFSSINNQEETHEEDN